MHRQNLSPIILFVYNRPTHTAKTVEALLKNAEAAESTLYIFADGPKTPEASVQVQKTRALIEAIDGFHRIIPVFRSTNIGLAESIITGVSEILRVHNSAIIIEDDIQVSSHFLSYMNKGLNEFAAEQTVASIHGWNYPLKCKEIPDTFFLRGADCWGWGTWKRAWNLFEPDGTKLLRLLEERNLTKRFDLDGAYPYTQMLRDQISGKNNSWAIRWHASMFLKNMLTLHPRESLVVNIGLDGSGVHSQADASLRTTLSVAPPRSFPQEITENQNARRAIIMYLEKSRRFSRMRSMLSGLKRRLVAMGQRWQ